MEGRLEMLEAAAGTRNCKELLVNQRWPVESSVPGGVHEKATCLGMYSLGKASNSTEL